MTTSSAFTVSVSHQGFVYDIEVTPAYNGTAIPGVDPSQWTLAERTGAIYSRTIQEMFTKSKITDDQLTNGLLTVSLGNGITLQDKTNIKDSETIEICDTFIRYLQQPASGIAELPPQAPAAVDPTSAPIGSSVSGLGASLRAQRNTYVNLDEDNKYDVRLSLFKKKCRELVGLSFPAYTPAELACRAYLLQHRKVNPIDTTDPTKLLEQEINDWFTHKYLFHAVDPKEIDENALSEQEIAEIELAERNIDAIELERVELASIGAKIKRNAEALKEAEAEAALARARAATRAAEVSDDELSIESLTGSSDE